MKKCLKTFWEAGSRIKVRPKQTMSGERMNKAFLDYGQKRSPTFEQRAKCGRIQAIKLWEKGVPNQDHKALKSH